MILEKKLINVGGSLGILLPMSWCKYKNLKKGDTVIVEVNEKVKIYPKGD